ncbi:V-set and immunoglobulin domain-containing protein 4-like isoform X3 [Corvus moneduloides]|uniref:V-set and immunoglobulin domain-containing protein 4-like isoform X3 n=1 Tax=Corvus moneduloides TaxID=1196302 RepID=UPI0013635887|nr:V-set and immunoglobulin domain-containing protein 4-like isoform X3 [Corvus moneduloides]
METLLRVAVLVSSLLHCSAFLDLSGPSEVRGVWRGSITLPCAYVPVEDLVQQTLTWTVVHDKGSGTIIRRDGSDDHILLSEYRDRVSIPKDAPGNVSLLILNLEVSDRGTYTCQVTWKDSNNSLIAKEITTKLEVVKVAATKPIIRAGQLGLTVPAGASTSLTCEASGSPPISYRWFRSVPAGKAVLLSSGAELAWHSLRPSDSGTYFCEAENRAGAGAVQRSDAVQLTVTDLPTTTVALQRNVATTGGHHSTTDLSITATTSESGVGYPGKNDTIHDFQRTGLSLYLVILIAVVCGAVVFLVISLIICVTKPKEAQVYDVKSRNLRAATSSSRDSTGYYEEPISSTENNYVMEPRENKISEEVNKNVSDCAGNPQESEYEVGDTS